MNNLTRIIFFAAACLVAVQANISADALTGDGRIRFSVDSQAVFQNPYRVGINLGTWTTWGAEQYMRNVIQNPGFEGAVDRGIVIVSASTTNSFSDETGSANGDNYWKGATYEVRSGPNVGASGTITSFKQSGDGGKPQYFTDTPLPQLKSRDVIAVSKEITGDPIPIWWLTANNTHADSTQNRSGSQGSQSLRLEPGGTAGPAKAFFYLDAIGSRAGKLLPINGSWKLSFWMKAAADGDTVEVVFKRANGSTPFLNQTFQPTTQWQEYTFNFNGVDDNPSPEILQLSIAVSGSANAWLDDVYLGQVQTGATNFRKEVVDALKLMRPSFIRNYAGFGDSYANMNKPAFGRKVWITRTSGSVGEASFSYSLDELMDLSKEVGANPWVIVPITWSDNDYLLFGQYIAKKIQEKGFSEVVVEFGNENWNWVFRPQGIPYYDVHGPIAERAFQHIMTGAGPNVNIRKLVNGQAAAPWVTNQYLINTPSADGVTTAPYFLYELNAGQMQSDVLNLMFAPDNGEEVQISNETAAAGKNLAIYEINMHTTVGNMGASERSNYVAGRAGGAALAQNIVKAILLKYNPVVVTGFAQFDVYLGQIGNYMRLWGTLRDLSGTKRVRPTGMAMIMLNQIIGGEVRKASLLSQDLAAAGSKVTIAAFQKNNQWRAAITNGNATPQDVELTFPDDGKALPNIVMILSSTSPVVTNESAQNVNITSALANINARKVRYTVPAYGFVILTTSTPVQ